MWSVSVELIFVFLSLADGHFAHQPVTFLVLFLLHQHSLSFCASCSNGIAYHRCFICSHLFHAKRLHYEHCIWLSYQLNRLQGCNVSIKWICISMAFPFSNSYSKEERCLICVPALREPRNCTFYDQINDASSTQMMEPCGLSHKANNRTSYGNSRNRFAKVPVTYRNIKTPQSTETAIFP